MILDKDSWPWAEGKEKFNEVPGDVKNINKKNTLSLKM